ncbi:unnamed protein product [Calypogeia fissa]
MSSFRLSLMMQGDSMAQFGKSGVSRRKGSRGDKSSGLFSVLVVPLLVLLLGGPIFTLVHGQGDADCLQEFKNSVDDPTGALSEWTFSNTTGGAVCSFTGVQCLHHGENSVYSLVLQGFSLGGSFPQGLSKCAKLQDLDLSHNDFSGPISPTLCTDVQNMVKLNLNDNQFSDSIPDNLGTCQFLNYLFLEDNHLTGAIPASLGDLPRLSEFNVSNNNLGGDIPYYLGKKINNSLAYGENPNLCGFPVNTKSGCPVNGSSSKNTGLIVGVAIGAVVAVLIVVGVAVWWLLLSRPLGYGQRDENRWIKRIKAPKSIIVSMFEKPLIKIKLSDLMAATNDFSSNNVIATGRTGTVYKGTLPDGSVMAIKRLQVTPHSDRQFRAEMETLGRLKHRNLVPLLGYCIAGPERLLVYKHMPNGSLQDHLRGGFRTGKDPITASQVVTVPGDDGMLEKPVELKKLDWETRLRIAIGGARGLAWLHHSCNPRVIHRNISPASLLLDEEFETKISDFGLARLMNPVDTHISTFINGDFGDVGYVAPEYVRTLVATVKGDVYSFGVVLLELITGKKPVDVTVGNFRGNLAEWIWHLTNTGNVASAIDVSLVTGTDQDGELMQFLKIGASCVVPQPKERPSMYEVFHMLRAIGEKYHFTDQDDEIPIATTTEELESPELIVAKS